MSIRVGDKIIAGSGSENVSFQTKVLTIPTTGWVEAGVGQYSYSISVPVAEVTAQDIISCSVKLESNETAVNCNLAFQNQSGEGTVTFYAETVPTAEIRMEYYVLKGR